MLIFQRGIWLDDIYLNEIITLILQNNGLTLFCLKFIIIWIKFVLDWIFLKYRFIIGN